MRAAYKRDQRQRFLFSGDRALLEPSRAALDSLPEALRQTGKLLSRSVAQARRFDTLQPLVREAVALLTATLKAEEAGRAPEAVALLQSGRGDTVMDQIRRRLSAMAAAEHSVNARLEARILREDRISLSLNLIAALLAVCFLSLAAFAINQDFKRRAQAEGERDRFFALSLDMLCIANADGYFKRISPAFTETLGWTVKEMLGRPFLDFVHPDDQAATLREVERQNVAGEPVLRFENRYRHKDGSWRVLSWRSVPQPGGFMFATARDVTDAHAAERALRSAKEAAEAANRAKSDFLAKMSHELRTPLNSIIGFSEILEDQRVGPLTDKQRRYVSNVLVSGRNLLQLINDILDLSKVEAGRMELVPSQFEAGAALDQVNAIVAALADRKGLNVELKVPASLPLLHADQAKFRQIMYNLLGNAVKFTPEGGRVTVSARVIHPSGNGTSGEWLEIEVADTGIGIAAEHLTRIFKEFEQVNADPSHSQEGTGLGLALTKKLVELHGGRVWVESEVGRGSVFRFSLPCARVRPHAVELAPSVPRRDSSDPAGPLVLVIDNDPAARDLIAHYLTEGGYRVESAADGEQAIRLSQTLQPDAITLDMLLPDRDGLLILAQLKTSLDTRHIPVVVVSVTDRRELGFSLGAAGWLVKPINKGALLQALEATTRGAARAGKPTVLVVDDDPATVAYLTELLPQRGFVVLSATGGRDGIALALTRQPDVIVLDLMMPEVNGFDVVRALRADSRVQGIPILILTAADLTRADAERLRSSVQAIVSKGGPNELLDELARICPVSAPAAEAATRGAS
ncbi:MAG TPA: response regulator [Thermoanaerobaculia bacterium]|nr:response regulator [Thermoanaerobaculia bacterium]